jgi:hypothetical protein
MNSDVLMKKIDIKVKSVAEKEMVLTVLKLLDDQGITICLKTDLVLCSELKH